MRKAYCIQLISAKREKVHNWLKSTYEELGDDSISDDIKIAELRFIANNIVGTEQVITLADSHSERGIVILIFDHKSDETILYPVKYDGDKSTGKILISKLYIEVEDE